ATFFEREVRRDERTTPFAGLDDDRRGSETGEDPVPRRETPRGGLNARRVLRDDQAALRDLFAQPGVRGWVDPVDPAAEHGDGRPAPAGLESTPVRLTVDSAGEAAD